MLLNISDIIFNVVFYLFIFTNRRYFRAVYPIPRRWSYNRKSNQFQVSSSALTWHCNRCVLVLYSPRHNQLASRTGRGNLLILLNLWTYWMKELTTRINKQIIMCKHLFTLFIQAQTFNRCTHFAWHKSLVVHINSTPNTLQWFQGIMEFYWTPLHKRGRWHPFLWASMFFLNKSSHLCTCYSCWTWAITVWKLLSFSLNGYT